MLSSLNSLRGQTLVALDGAFGTVDDVYFDDDSWTVRYLVVGVGGFFDRRVVVVSTSHVRLASSHGDGIPVSLTRQEIVESPEVEGALPFSRKEERRFHDYFGLPYYWSGPFLYGGVPYPPSVLPPPLPSREYGVPESSGSDLAANMGSDVAALQDYDHGTEETVHIRSVREVTGYAVAARDDTFGSVDDVVVDEDWTVRYLVIDTVKYWPSKSVLVSPDWVESISWDQRSFALNLTEEQIKEAPAFRSLENMTRAEEERLFEHYGREGYWSQASDGSPRKGRSTFHDPRAPSSR